MSQLIFSDLLDRVQLFYRTSKDTDFEAKILRRNTITADKINNLIAQVESPMAPLAQQAKQYWKNVLNWDSMQFPNYYLAIDLDGIEQAPHIVTRQRRLVLCVSLLCWYYTLFYEEDYTFTQMFTSEETMPPIYRIYFQDLANDVSGLLKADLTKMQNLCEKHFPGYTFVDHRWIMTFKVPDMLTDTGEPQIPERSIYFYLFDKFTTYLPSVLI